MPDKRIYRPALPIFVDRLKLTWEYAHSKIEEFLEVHPLEDDVCRGCFIIFIHSLFSYLLPDTVLLQEDRFCELQGMYVSTYTAYLKAIKDKTRSAQSLINDFEVELYSFTENQFDCSNDLVHKHIIQLIEYQKKVWEFCSCHESRKMNNGPLPYHSTGL